MITERSHWSSFMFLLVIFRAQKENALKTLAAVKLMRFYSLCLAHHWLFFHFPLARPSEAVGWCPPEVFLIISWRWQIFSPRRCFLNLVWLQGSISTNISRFIALGVDSDLVFCWLLIVLWFFAHSQTALLKPSDTHSLAQSQHQPISRGATHPERSRRCEQHWRPFRVNKSW